MSSLSVGDLGRSFQLRRDTSNVTMDIQRLTRELSSGLKSDLTAAVSGDYGPLAAMERDLSSIAAYRFAADEAALVGRAAQEVLGQISVDGGEAAANLLLSRSIGQPALVDNATADARQRLEASVTGLNSQVAGRSVFSGQAYQSPALADPEIFLADLYAVVSLETTVPDAQAAIDAWFAPGGGFETVAYLGTPEDAVPVQLGDGAQAQPTIRAIDPRIVETLKGLSTAALLDMGLFSGDFDARTELAYSAGQDLLSASDELNAARAQIGEQQEAVDRAITRGEAERAAIETARSEIMSADPFDTAVLLQNAQSRLESLYVLTSRLSNLSLTNYLR